MRFGSEIFARVSTLPIIHDRIGSAGQLTKPSDQLRWSIQDKKLKNLLMRGFNSADSTIQKQAAECRDLLLKLGFFDFLDIDNKRV
jgi:hypothetical protein